MSEPAHELVCPSCALTHPAGERFCSRCSMPLVQAGANESTEEPGRPLDEIWQRARRIRPQYSEGELVRVAGAQNQPEAEFIRGLLLEEGIPSLQRRAPGFDVPDFLAAGPREILVPASGAEAAREALLLAESVEPDGLSAELDGPSTAQGGGC